MGKATVYSIVLAPELRDAFLAAAAACDRPPAQVLRGLMREFIQRQQEAAEEVPDEGAESAATENITAVTDQPEAIPEQDQATVAEAAPAADSTESSTEADAATDTPAEAKEASSAATT